MIPLRPRHRPGVPAALVLLLSLAPGAAAFPSPADSPSTAEDDAAAEDNATDQAPALATEHVVVTATRTPTPESQVASAVTVITGEDLERRQLRLVVDALRQVPGLDLRRTGGPGSTSSIFLRGTNSDHVLVLLDGVELNDPSSPDRLPFLDNLTTDAVERIEIIRGPQSTLYGADAIGGVINIITRPGGGPLQVSVLAEAGAYRTAGERVALSGGQDSFRYAGGISHLATDSFSAAAGGGEDDPFRDTAAHARLGWTLTQRASLEVTARHTDARVHFDGFASEEGNRIDSEQTVLRVQPRLSYLGGRWIQRIGLSGTRHDRDTISANPSRIQGDLLAVDVENAVALGSRQTLTFGAEGEWEDASFPTFRDSARTLAVYVQDQILAGDRFFGTVGARVDRHSEFGTEATYRLTGGRRFARTGTTLQGSAGSGFKAPSLSQLNSGAFGGNPDLEAETSRGYDLGVLQELGGERAGVGVTIFRNDIDELIVAVFDAGSGQFLNQNIDAARAEGVEVTFHARAVRWLHVGGSYTYTDTEAEGSPAGFGLSPGSRLLRRPRHKAALDLAGRFASGRGRATLGGVYVGERADIDPVSFAVVDAPDHVVLNLALSYDLPRGVRLFGRVDNLLDEEYQDVLGFGTAGFSAYGGVAFRWQAKDRAGRRLTP